MESKLAILGGTPIRKNPLPHTYPGAALYGEEEIEALKKVVISQSPFRYYGPNNPTMVNNFEKDLMSMIGRKHCVAVTSCTASLVVALKGAGIGIGDKVIVPAITFMATAGAVVCAGAVPVFCDCDESFNIDPSKIVDVIDDEVKAIITVPLQGNPCEMDKIMEVAKKHNLIVIEDVAQSIGSKYKGEYSGSIGDIGCFSLQMNKIITTGEGGAVTTNNFEIYKRAVRYHDQGMFRDEEGFLSTEDNGESFMAQNYRMSEFTGAVAIEQLKKLNGIIERLKEIKTTIKNEIKDIDLFKFRKINDIDGDASCSLFLVFQTQELAVKFSKYLSAENISAKQLYDGMATFMQPQVFNQRTAEKDNFPFNMVKNKVVYTKDMCPNATDIMARHVMIQLSPTFTQSDVSDIINGIKKVVNNM